MTTADLHIHGRLTDSSRAETDRLAAAHHRYAATRDAALRAELVEAYSPLVKAIAKRFAGRGELLEDLQQTAFVGLLEALDRFDPNRGSRFVSFAVPTMVGHLKRHFRERRWRMHVPRSVQERYLLIRSARDDLTQDLQRIPTVLDIATALGLRVDQVVEAMEAGDTFGMTSLEALPHVIDHVVSTDRGEGYREVDDRLFVDAVVSRLPDPQRRVVALRFGGELTQAEIGRRIGTSQMQVSRLLSRSLARLRSMSETGGNEDTAVNQ
jgi:RNA polymerase sigma-B factor